MFDKGYWKRPNVAQVKKKWLIEIGYNFTGLDVGCGTGYSVLNRKQANRIIRETKILDSLTPIFLILITIIGIIMIC